MSERDFKGIWIPARIWLDDRLSPIEKIVLMEIDSLDNGTDGCFAGNDWLAQRCQCSERKIRDAIAKLKEIGFITLVSFDGRTRRLHSKLTDVSCETRKKCLADRQNLPHSNKSSIGDRELDRITSITSVSSNDGFDEFWSIYPKKVGKKAAMAAWRKLKPSAELQSIILADLKRRLEPGGTWYKKEKTYIKDPSGYLNGERWEDETEVKEHAQPARPAEPELTDEQIEAIKRVYAENGRDAWM